MSSKDNEADNNNYIRLAQIEAALFLDLSFHPESFENVLGLHQNFDINYRIPETFFIKSNRSHMIGTALLNVTLDMFQDDMFMILINRGADFTNKNGYNESTVVHDSIGDNFGKQLAAVKSRGFLEDNGFAKKTLDAHVDLNISKNPHNSYGLTHFHIACMRNHTKAVEYFLKNKIPVDEAVDKDSPMLPGFTALHLSAKYCTYETAEILLNYGADVNLKDGNGMSALHILVQERLRTWPAALRVMKADVTYGSDCIKKYFDENEKILKLFLKKNSICTLNSTDDIGFSNLQAACTLQDTSLVKQVLSKKNVNLNDSVKSDSLVWPGYTALHFAAHFNAETFKILLEKGANMEVRDVQGNSPFGTCLISFKVADIHSILSYHSNWKNILFSDGKTKLLDFIYAMQEPNEFKLFLDSNVTNINMFIPLDSPICAGYTPLHLAVICNEKPPNYNESENAGYPTVWIDSYDPIKTTLYGTRIKNCLDLGASVTAQDAQGSTPLHWAFHLQESSLVKLLLNHHEQFVNPANEDGLSHLHIACASQNELITMKLLLNRTDVNMRVKADYSWYSDEYSRIFVRSGSTPLHFAVECPKITEILLECGADVLAVDDKEFNPLEKVLGGRLARDTRLQYSRNYGTEKEKVLRLLIHRLSEALSDSTDGPEKLLCCYNLLLSNFLMSILETDDEIRSKILDKVGLTRLHVACIKNDVNRVRELLQQDIDVNAQVDSKSPKWCNLTPLFCYLVGRELRKDESNDFSVAKLLLEHGADVMKKCDTNTAIHQAFKILTLRQMPYESEVPIKNCNNDQVLLKLLLNYHKDYSMNPKNTTGLTHLHIACACNNVDMVEGLLKNGADVNQKIDYFCIIFGGNTALHLAAIYKSNATVDVLLKHGADVHSTNNYDSTPIHVAAKTRTRSLKILKALLKAGADGNAKNIIGATPVELMMEYTSFTKNEVEIFLKNGFQVNIINPVTKEGCLAIALKENQSFDFVYEMFLGSTDVRQLDEMNRNAIHNVVSLKRPREFDSGEESIDEAFLPVEVYTKAIAGLMKLNSNIDQQDREGKTPLHYAAQMQNVTAIIGLLNNGADFNFIDESGKTAFTYSAKFADEVFTDYHDLDQRIMQIFVSHVYTLP